MVRASPPSGFPGRGGTPRRPIVAPHLLVNAAGPGAGIVAYGLRPGGRAWALAWLRGRSKEAAFPDGIKLGPGAADDPVVGDKQERGRRRGRCALVRGLDEDLVGGDLEAARLGP